MAQDGLVHLRKLLCLPFLLFAIFFGTGRAILSTVVSRTGDEGGSLAEAGQSCLCLRDFV
jgi:hypothetical protein